MEKNSSNKDIMHDSGRSIITEFSGRTIEENMLLEKNTNNKHKKYEEIYKNIEEDIYWGLGIENELYLEFDNKIKVTKKFLLNNRRRERYSVDYFLSYKKELLDILFKDYLELYKDDYINVPLLINSHSFLNTDSSNNSQKLYTKLCEPNPKFNGKTLLESIIENNNKIKESYNKEWLFDGDTIEFTTINFYKTKLENVIKELNLFKQKFIINLQNYQIKNNLFTKYGSIKFMEKNHPFAIHLTNINNIAMFNNGTLHYNITLPTLLKNKKIVDFEKFTNIHKKAIKMIQWFEPFLITVYNTIEPFYILKKTNSNNIKSIIPIIPCSSQRCVISRYIGIGTYDSDKMERGKILTIPITNFENLPIGENWWYNKFHENSIYNKLENIGLDINFNKHYNHGIELRFFDNIFDEKLLKESFEFIIYLMDYLLDKYDSTESENNILNPIYNNLWNNFLIDAITNGRRNILSIDLICFYEKLLDIDIQNTVSLKNINNIYYYIYYYSVKKYNKILKLNNNLCKVTPIGKFSKLTLITKTIDYIELKSKFEHFNIKFEDILEENIINNQDIKKSTEIKDNKNKFNLCYSWCS